MDVKIVVALIGLLGVILGSSMKFLGQWWFSRQKKRKYQLDKVINYEMKVYELINDLKKQHSADRVCIAKFHNGGSFIDGLPMQKFSITNEVFSDATRPIRREFKEALLGNYAPMMMDLIYHGYVKPEENKIDHELKKHQIPNSSFFIIKDDRGLPLGYLSIGFKDENRSLKSDDIHNIENICKSLFALLKDSFKN